MSKPKAYILVGVPGSGKSTWYKNNEWVDPAVYVSTDHFIEIEANRVGKTYSEVFDNYMSTAVRLMTETVNEAKKLKMNIVWDQTSTTIVSRRKKFNMLPNYEMIAVVFPTPDTEELKKRLASRPGKHIPTHVIKSMISNWQEPTEAEGFDKIIYIK